MNNLFNITTSLRQITLMSALALLIGLSGCSKEMVAPDGQTPAVHSTLNPPATPCGDSEFHDLLDASSTIAGEVEIINDDQDLYLLISAESGWHIREYAAFVGASEDIPNESGVCQPELFPYIGTLNPLDVTHTITVPLASIGSCNAVCLWLEIVELNQFGQVIDTREVILDGTSIYDVTYVDYCNQVC